MKVNNQHREKLLQYLGLILPPHATANSTGTGNHTTALSLVRTHSHTGQNGPVGREAEVPSLASPPLLPYLQVSVSGWQSSPDWSAIRQNQTQHNRYGSC